MTTATFPPEVVDAVCEHMNHDHPEDCLLIVRGLAARHDASAARMVGLDQRAAEFEVAGVEGSTAVVQVPFAEPVVERRQIRVQVVRMYHDACVALGVEPRAEGEH